MYTPSAKTYKRPLADLGNGDTSQSGSRCSVVALLPGLDLTAGDGERIADRYVGIRVGPKIWDVLVDRNDPTGHTEVDARVEDRVCMLMPELHHDVARSHPVARYRFQLGGALANKLVQCRGVFETAKSHLKRSFHILLQCNICAGLRYVPTSLGSAT